MNKTEQIPVRPRKGERLIQHLEGMIVSGLFAAGHKLPPLRELQQQFELSYSTTQRCIAFLCRRGLLEKTGKEIVIGRRTKREGRNFLHQVTVFIEPWRFQCQKSGLYLSALAGVQKAALEQNFSLMVCPINMLENDQRFIYERSRSSAGIILLLELDYFFRELSPEVPAVGVQIADNYGDRLSLVDIDPFSCAEQAARYFQRYGISRIKVFSNARPTYFNRADAFCRSWRKATGRDPELLVTEDGKPPAGVILQPDDGLFFTSDSTAALHIQEYAKQTGRQMQKDFRLLSIDGKRLISTEFGVFPTIAVDWREIGTVAFEECQALIEYPGRRRRRIWLPGTLFEE